MSEQHVSLEELKLLFELELASCGRCEDDFQLYLAIYRLYWTPEQSEYVILCVECSGIVHRFLARLRGMVP